MNHPTLHLWTRIAAIMAAAAMISCASWRQDRRAVPARESVAARQSVSHPESPLYRYFYIEAARQKLLENHTAAIDLLRHCLAIDPDAPAAVYDMAIYDRLLRRDSLALAGLRRAVELDPDNVQCVEALASYYLDNDSAEEATRWLERMAELKPRRTDVLSRLVALYSQTDRPADAIRALDRIELLEGKLPAASYRKFAIYKQMGRTKEAYACLEDLCREFPHELSYRLAIANELLADDRTDEAMAVFDEVRRADPANVGLAMSLLQFHRQRGDTAAFVAARDSLLYAPGSPTDVRVALMRDYIAEQMANDSIGAQRVDTAFARLGIATTTDPELLNLKAAFLATYESDNDSAFAEVMDRVNAIDPTNQQALYYLIQYYGQQQDYQRLEAICRRGVINHPEELVCHFYLGLALYQQDKSAEALQAFRGGIMQKTPDSRPDIVADLYSIMGDILHESGQRRQAYEAYDSCLAYKDDNAACLNNYAYFLSIEDGDLDRAEEMSYRTIRLHPDNATYLDTYAWILFQKGRYAEAARYIDRVCPPDSADSILLASPDLSGVVLEHAGDIAALNGNTEQALRFWRLAIQLGGKGLSATLTRKIKLKKYLKQ